jgi:hypothetical protein
MVENNAGMLRRSYEDRALYGFLRRTRVKADYKADDVDAADLRPLCEDIAHFVEEPAR